jgi:argininosuccinate synthase
MSTAVSEYRIDENLWGRVIECGVLDDPGNEVPEDVFLWTESAGVIGLRNATLLH